MLSQAIEDYLKTIYKLHEGEAVTTSEIARSLNVSPASVSNMVKRLAKMKLVVHQAYHGVTLTVAGRKIALEIIRHHRLLETYLREIMGYDWERMHNEAEQLEHHISEEFEERLDEMLGYPTHDPHGDPIPSRDGQIPDSPAFPLTDFPAGESIVIHRLPGSDPELLSELETRGILPNARAKVVQNDEIPGLLSIQIGDHLHVLDYANARLIFGASTDSGLSTAP